ncbi:hypothetical protein [Listeria ivanovii]|uniref:hypothetical protein n=1 Tax=Listeria ivanovii TaxID=1638 RepID=UPI0030D621B9
MRDNSTEDLKWIEFFKCMRSSGLSIDSLARYTKLFQLGNVALQGRKKILDLEYEKLLGKQTQINETVLELGVKIKNYEPKIKQFR